MINKCPVCGNQPVVILKQGDGVFSFSVRCKCTTLSFKSNSDIDTVKNFINDKITTRER